VYGRCLVRTSGGKSATLSYMFRGCSEASQVKTGSLPRIGNDSPVVLNLEEIIPRFFNNYYSGLQNVRTVWQFPNTVTLLWLILGVTFLYFFLRLLLMMRIDLTSSRTLPIHKSMLGIRKMEVTIHAFYTLTLKENDWSDVSSAALYSLMVGWESGACCKGKFLLMPRTDGPSSNPWLVTVLSELFM